MSIILLCHKNQHLLMTFLLLSTTTKKLVKQYTNKINNLLFSQKLRPGSLLSCLDMEKKKKETILIDKFWRFFLCNDFLAMWHIIPAFMPLLQEFFPPKLLPLTNSSYICLILKVLRSSLNCILSKNHP